MHSLHHGRSFVSLTFETCLALRLMSGIQCTCTPCKIPMSQQETGVVNLHTVQHLPLW